ncbi:hypothetical protein BO83DRAFT_446676, partial [Aspergillus eucalypticola CBS 122712]
WEVSTEGVNLLLDYGIEYDHSPGDHDCQCFYTRVNDSWTKIDYTKNAETWIKSFVRSNPSVLVQIPGIWYIDDLFSMKFIKSSANSHGWVSPCDVEDIWRDTFDYYYQKYDEFVFSITIHPDVSGRP